MYIPAHFAVDDPDRVADFVDRAGAAHLVTFDGTEPSATLLPVIWDRTTEPGRLLGHIAKANDQWRTARPDIPALAIVPGPEAYISASWYENTAETGRSVPTWNYVTVHFTGPVTFHQDPDWLLGVVTRLTDRHEHGRDPRWWVNDAPPAYLAGQLRGIVGIEMTITKVEAKEKLSQNRAAADRSNVIAALRAEPDAPGARAIAGLMAARSHDRPPA